MCILILKWNAAAYSQLCILFLKWDAPAYCHSHTVQLGGSSGCTPLVSVCALPPSASAMVVRESLQCMTVTLPPQELDFEHEAGNMARCDANLSSPRCRVAGDVAVPKVTLNGRQLYSKHTQAASCHCFQSKGPWQYYPVCNGARQSHCKTCCVREPQMVPNEQSHTPGPAWMWTDTALQAVLGLTSKRVLTMEYMDGVSVNDVQGLADMGADLSEVIGALPVGNAAKNICISNICKLAMSFSWQECASFSPQVSHLISQAFAEMVFTFGDVHCDPHAGEVCM